MVALPSRGILAVAAPVGTRPRHIGLTDTEACRDFANAARRVEYAIAQILPIGLSQMPDHRRTPVTEYRFDRLIHIKVFVL